MSNIVIEISEDNYKMASDDVLCCCEYVNNKGERSHLLACCCDCEAFDQMADRLLKCEKVPPSLLNSFMETFTDRCRIPGLLGGGAMRLNLEVVTPIVIIPLSLVLCAIGPIITLIVLSLLPYFCLVFYFLWKKKTKKSRTKFFFVWGLTSVVFMYILFETIVCANANISIFDNILTTAAIIAMLVALFYAKKDPGIVPEDRLKQYLHDSYSSFGLAMTKNSSKEDLDGFEVIEISDIPTNGNNQEMGYSRDQSFSPHYLDTRENWCSICCIEKPTRSGHCNVCNVCIQNRDHHCVWIDSCVGAKNHRSFLVAMVIFVFIGYYGGYLTLTAVCDPNRPHDIMCSYYVAYRDFKWGLCYASAWYVIVVSTLMLIGLVHQVLLISQNMTSQEHHIAARFGDNHCFIYNPNNIHNHGFIQNWSDFILKRRYVGHYETV
ncbi:Pfam:zf-DHHC [Mactra antiquata]